jgi:hypothetical protein
MNDELYLARDLDAGCIGKVVRFETVDNSRPALEQVSITGTLELLMYDPGLTATEDHPASAEVMNIRIGGGVLFQLEATHSVTVWSWDYEPEL